MDINSDHSKKSVNRIPESHAETFSKATVLSEVGIKQYKGNTYGIENLDYTATKQERPSQPAKNERVWDEIFQKRQAQHDQIQVNHSEALESTSNQSSFRFLRGSQHDKENYFADQRSVLEIDEKAQGKHTNTQSPVDSSRNKTSNLVPTPNSGLGKTTDNQKPSIKQEVEKRDTD